jgi:hypothetical protein
MTCLTASQQSRKCDNPRGECGDHSSYCRHESPTLVSPSSYYAAESSIVTFASPTPSRSHVSYRPLHPQLVSETRWGNLKGLSVQRKLFAFQVALGDCERTPALRVEAPAPRRLQITLGKVKASTTPR